MIEYRYGDLFNNDVQVLVNPVNCKGVMGKGLALQFKERFGREYFRSYQRDCHNGRLSIGRPTLYQESTPWIMNFPTKDDWQKPSTLPIIARGLEYVVTYYRKAHISSIVFPKLGCKNGGLSWSEVGPMMAYYLNQMYIPVVISINEGDERYY